MLDKNSLPLGLALAILVPAIAIPVLYGIFEILEMLDLVSDSGFRPKFRERTITIIAIGANAILLNSFQKKRLIDSMRGIVIGTVALVVVWLILYGQYVL